MGLHLLAVCIRRVRVCGGFWPVRIYVSVCLCKEVNKIHIKTAKYYETMRLGYTRIYRILEIERKYVQYEHQQFSKIK